MLRRSTRTPKKSARASASSSPSSSSGKKKRASVAVAVAVVETQEAASKRSRVEHEMEREMDADFLFCPYCAAPLEPSFLYDHVVELHPNDANHRRPCGVCISEHFRFFVFFFFFLFFLHFSCVRVFLILVLPVFYGGDPDAAAGNLPSHLKEHHPEMAGASRRHLQENREVEEMEVSSVDLEEEGLDGLLKEPTKMDVVFLFCDGLFCLCSSYCGHVLYQSCAASVRSADSCRMSNLLV
jgi:hypothetical protein